MSLTGATAHWKLDESSGNAIDATGNGNTLTNSNVTYSAGKLGNGAVFNGTTSKFTGPSITSGTAGFSFSTWIKTTASSGFIFGKRATAGGAGISFCQLNGSGIPVFYDYDGSAFHFNALSGAKAINDGNWHHIVLTVNNGHTSGKIYIDSVLGGTQSVSGLSWNTDAFTLGNDYAGGSFFNGMLDEGTAFPFELTADEVSQLFNSNRANAYPFTATPSLYGEIVDYKLDESSGNAVNSIGSNNPGVNTGVTYGPAKINNGAIFDSATDKLDIGNIGSIAQGTIMGWIKVPSGTGTDTDRSIIGQNTWNGAGQSTLIVTSRTAIPYANKLYFYVYGDTSGDGANTSYLSSSSIPATTWTHVAVTFDTVAKQVKYYINGILDRTSPTYTTLPTPNFSSMSLGNWFPGVDRNLSGSLDAFGVWNRLCTPTEIAAHCNGGAGLQWPFATVPTISNAPFIINFM